MLSNVSHLVYIIIAPVLGVGMAYINILTVYIFKRVFRLQSFAIVILTNICLCDIFVSLFSNTFYVINLAHPRYNWWTGNISCKLFKTVTMTTNIAQIFSLCLLNADRIRRIKNSTGKQWRRVDGFHALVIIWLISAALCAPEMFLFSQKLKMKFDPNNNQTEIANSVCKPDDRTTTFFAVSTILLFVVGFCLPSIYIVYALASVHYQLWLHNRNMHEANAVSATQLMNKALSRTFSLTGLLFLLVWTPFFILTILDLKYNIVGQAALQGVNFGLRCTLLMLGSAKPVFYMICLEKFRMAIRHTSIRRVMKEMVERKMSDTGPACSKSSEGPMEGTAKGATKGSTEGTTNGSTEGTTEGMAEWAIEGMTEEMTEGTANGTTEGTTRGSTEGTTKGTTEGMAELAIEGMAEGMIERTANGTTEGTTRGSTEGTTEETTEEMAEWATEGMVEGMTEGTANGTTEETTERMTEFAIERMAEKMTEVTANGTTEGTTRGSTEGTTKGITEGMTEFAIERMAEEMTEVTANGTTEGTTRGSTDGTTKGIIEGMTEFAIERMAEEMTEVTANGTTKGTTRGSTVGTTEETTEEMAEWAIEGKAEGMTEGIAKDTTEGMAVEMTEWTTEKTTEGLVEGTTKGTANAHAPTIVVTAI